MVPRHYLWCSSEPHPKPDADFTTFDHSGIQPVAFLITSAIAVFLTVLFGYLFFLTATN